MPEIAIHEHRDPLARENDVGLTGQGAEMAPEPQSSRPQPLLHEPFQRTVFQLHPLHRPRTLLRSQVVFAQGVTGATTR